jgi:hypothetical protein
VTTSKRKPSNERDLVLNINISECRFAAVETRDYVVLDQMLKTWRKNNRELGLTGGLLLCDGAFVHVLEGTPAGVKKMRARVAADPLHTNVRNLREQPCVKRRFLNWPLAYVGPSRWVQRALKNHELAAMGPETPDEAEFLVDLILCFVGDDASTATELSLPAWV